MGIKQSTLKSIIAVLKEVATSLHHLKKMKLKILVTQWIVNLSENNKKDSNKFLEDYKHLLQILRIIEKLVLWLKIQMNPLKVTMNLIFKKDFS